MKNRKYERERLEDHLTQFRNTPNHIYVLSRFGVMLDCESSISDRIKTYSVIKNGPGLVESRNMAARRKREWETKERRIHAIKSGAGSTLEHSLTLSQQKIQ